MASKAKYQEVGGENMPNNFSAKKPADAKAPKMGGSSFGVSPNSKDRGKDGTSK
jgi:hypothetical protein